VEEKEVKIQLPKMGITYKPRVFSKKRMKREKLVRQFLVEKRT